MSEVRPLSPWRIELGATLQLAAPLALTNLLQMLVHAIDVMFVARLGTDALAASSLGITVFGLTMWGLSALTGASAALIAAELGQRRHAVREVRRSVRMALWLAVASGLIGMAICSAGEDLLVLSGQSPVIAAKAGLFLDILRWAMIPMIVSSVLRVFVAALGKPGYATWITLGAIITNTLGNWVFVYGKLGMAPMGLEGSALSSIVTSLMMILAYAAVIRSDGKLRRYHILGRWWRAEWRRLADILRIGVPIMLTVLAEAGLFSSAALLMGRIGEAELAAHTLALNITSIAFQVPFGICQAATIRVGYHYGAANRQAAGLAGWAALALSVGFMAITASVMLFLPETVLRIYIDPDLPQNAQMVALAVQYLAIAAAFQLFDGSQAVMAGALRGLQDTRLPMAIAILGYWAVGFAISVWLGFHTPLGGLGVWLGLAAGLVAVAAPLTWRWHRREKLGLVPG